ncbi:MAG TPA: hypothetical protein VGL42_17105 [Opitutaceae bacterium]
MSRSHFLPAYYVRAGSEVTFTASLPEIVERVRWRRDGRELKGAAGTVLTLANVSTLATGTYSLAVCESGSEAVSEVATLTVVTESHFSEISAQACAGNAAKALHLGFVLDGAGGTSVLVRGTSDAPAADFEVTLFGSKPIGQLPVAPGASETTLITDLETGRYSMIVAEKADRPARSSAAVADLSRPGALANLVNASARGLVEPGCPLQIEFSLAGTTAGTILVRGVGPSLNSVFGLEQALNRALLEVRDDQGELLASNDGWRGEIDLADAFQRCGAFGIAVDALDAAVVLTLQPGRYRVTLASGPPAEAGLGLIEIYEVPSQ